jgi:hypothetical protein
VYSRPLQQLEPAWAFFKPLLLLLPFATGVLAMHPRWAPLDYHVLMLAHVLSACLVLALLPFARLFRLHVRLTRVLPEAAWEFVEPERAATASPAHRTAAARLQESAS